jgi:hypothetical protein
MVYRKLFSIEIIHPYYSSDEWIDATILPDELTLQSFKDTSYCLRALKNGVGVFVNADAPFPDLTIQNKLTFEVFPTSPTFNMYRDLSDLQPDDYLLFSNQTLLNELQLVPTVAHAASKYLNGFQIAAQIDIYPTALFNNPDKDINYTATFKIKSAVWKYYFVTQADEKKMWIEDAAFTPLKFNQLDIANQLSDPVLMGLQYQFPDDAVSVFASDTTVPFQRKGRKKIQLVRNGQVLIENLPNPTDAAQPINILKIF